MTIRKHLGILVACCSLGAVLLTAFLGRSYNELDNARRRLGDDALVQRDFGHLIEQTGAFFTMCDLVLGSGETYLAQAADAQGDHLQEFVETLREPLLFAALDGSLSDISRSVERIRGWVREGAALHGPQRDAGLHRLLARMDDESMVVITNLETVQEDVRQAVEISREALEENRASTDRLAAAFGLVYLFVVFGLWQWTASALVRPLCALATRAQSAMTDGVPFELEERGPSEVRQLAGNLTALVANLRAAHEEMEKKVEERTAELAAANRAKSDFLASVSHELRTPLNVIIGMTQLALDGEPSSEQREYLEDIQSSSDALLHLINDVLDFSRIEAGHMSLDCVSFDPRRMVHDVVQLLRRRAQEKNLSMCCSIDSDLPALVEGDPNALRQVLLNLLANAVKFTPEGSVSVSLKCPAISGGRAHLELEVADTGIGIPPQCEDRIFDRFFQVDGSTGRRFGGTGLGLSISKTLIDLMGGALTLADTSTAGSTFRVVVELPIAHAEEVCGEEDASSSHEARDGHALEQRPKARILLIEDNKANRKLATRILENAGYEVEAVDGGEPGLNQMRKHAFALVLTDIEMPGMDGFETARRIRTLGTPYATSVPIVALTAHAVEGYKARCIEAGMNDYLTKPFTRQSLVASVEHWTQADPAPSRSASEEVLERIG